MFDQIQKILKENNILFHQNTGVTIVTVEHAHQGYGLLNQMLKSIIDAKTVLYLSGGSTPKVLYEKLAQEEILIPGAVGMVDERYGPTNHEKSNQKMIGETGLLRYFQMRNIPFYPMLQARDREATAEAYDEQLRTLHATYQKSVAIMGIGSDGHTAGIAGTRVNFQNPLFEEERKHLLVSEFDDPQGMFKERITMTFLGLAMIDLLIVPVFGEDKKDALKMVFEAGREEEIPARFFTRPEIAKKTVLLTDQQI